SALTTQPLEVLPATHSPQSLLLLRTWQTPPVPPEQTPLEQSSLTAQVAPGLVNPCAPAEQNLSLQLEFTVQLCASLVFCGVHTPPVCCVPSPQNVQSARHPAGAFGSAGSQVSPSGKPGGSATS